MYPVLKEETSMGTFMKKDSDKTYYFIENKKGMFEISPMLWEALYNADGTAPLDLPDQGRSVIPKLKKDGFIKESRFIREQGTYYDRFILFPICYNRKHQMICREINTVLPVVSFLSFIAGIIFLFTGTSNICDDVYDWLYYFIALSSIFLHEGGHAIAGIAYKYKMEDMGILLLKFIPVPLGAYVAFEKKEKSTTREERQVALAGIEVNMLIVGICLIWAKLWYSMSLTFILSACLNALLIIINLLPTAGLDGEMALSAIFGVERISKTAVRWMTSKKRRRKLIHSGLIGIFCLLVFAIIILSKVLFWLVNLFNVFIILYTFI